MDDKLTVEKKSLRDEIGECMTVLGENENIVVVTADLMGTCRLRSFKEKYPDRFFNVGIAEQDMISFAAGLAHEGFMPYVFTMAPFMSMRACEQVRTDVAYANLNVRMIATYAGVSGGISGATHWGMEDVGIMSSIPGIAVIESCDATETRKLMEATLDYNGPLYYRNSVLPLAGIYSKNESAFHIGSSKTIIDGNDGAFLVSGLTVQYAIEASKDIDRLTGKHIRVVDMYSLKPIDRQAILSAAYTGRVVAAQDHNVYGGLGSLVSKVIAEEGVSTRLIISGINDKFVPMAHAQYLYHEFGYDTEGLFKSMMSLLQK